MQEIVDFVKAKLAEAAPHSGDDAALTQHAHALVGEVTSETIGEIAAEASGEVAAETASEVAAQSAAETVASEVAAERAVASFAEQTQPVPPATDAAS